MSIGLVTTAMKYKRAFGSAVPDSLVQQFIAMSRSYSEILNHSSFLKEEGILDIIYLVDAELRRHDECPNGFSWRSKENPFYPMVKMAADLFSVGLPSREHFMKMVAVAEVMRT